MERRGSQVNYRQASCRATALVTGEDCSGSEATNPISCARLERVAGTDIQESTTPQQRQPSKYCSNNEGMVDPERETLRINLYLCLQESSHEDDENEGSKSVAGGWKPQIHFAWKAILDRFLASESPAPPVSFQEFFRVVVDGTSA